MWLPDVTNLRDAFPNERRPPEDHPRDARTLLNNYHLDTYSHVIPGLGEAAASEMEDAFRGKRR
jgi:hypothetical protein